MKEKIYTIPINDAFDAESECPFCVLKQKLEDDVLNYILGPSYMEEDTREQTDKLGFCSMHYHRMFSAGNRLGLAMILKTHIQKFNNESKTLLMNELEMKNHSKKGIFGVKETTPPSFCSLADDVSTGCFACSRIENSMDNYYETFFYLWKTEEEFRTKVIGSKGFCINHFSRILSIGKKKLNKTAYAEMLKSLVPIQLDNFGRIEDELEWFIKKFDYRFKDEPWKTSKDAVERGILKVSGQNGVIL